MSNKTTVQTKTSAHTTPTSGTPHTPARPFFGPAPFRASESAGPNAQLASAQSLGHRFDAIPVQVGPEGGKAPPEVETAINRARGRGEPLTSALQEEMAKSMGHDFSAVRVHTDSQADALNRQLSAKAFTTGQDIFFKRGAYDASSDSGRDLIAHELGHVVQQAAGRVSDGNGMIVRPGGDAYEQDAEADVRRKGRVAYGGQNKPATASGESQKANNIPKTTSRSSSDDQFPPQNKENGPVQRKVFINKKQQETQEKDKGKKAERERNLSLEEMKLDGKYRWFNDNPELDKYLNNQTDDIGWVDRELTWIRFPSNELLVLGETHNETTLPDLVNATGCTKYKYEGGPVNGKDKLVDPVTTTAEHMIEPSLPKYILGLLGVAHRLEQAPKTDGVPEQEKAPQHEGYAEWLEGQLGKLSTRRKEVYEQKPASVELKTKAPKKPEYDRQSVEVRLAKQAVEYWNSLHDKKFHASGDLQCAIDGKFPSQAQLEEARSELKKMISELMKRMEELPKPGKGEVSEDTKKKLQQAFCKKQVEYASYSQELISHVEKAETERDLQMAIGIVKANKDGIRVVGMGLQHEINIRAGMENALEGKGIAFFSMDSWMDKQRHQHVIEPQETAGEGMRAEEPRHSSQSGPPVLPPLPPLPGKGDSQERTTR